MADERSHEPGTPSTSGDVAPDDAGPAPRPRGPRGDRGEVRRRITDAALRSFADHGLDGASTRSIAREADCDPALVRYYFASKQALFDHVTRRPEAVDSQLAAMAALPHARRAAYLADVVEACWDDPATRDFWRSLLRSSRTDVTVARQVEDTWADFVALGMRRGAPVGPADGRAAADGQADGQADGVRGGDGRTDPLTWPAPADDDATLLVDGAGPQEAAVGAVHAPDHLRPAGDAAAPLVTRRLVDPDGAGPPDVEHPDTQHPDTQHPDTQRPDADGRGGGTTAGDERERTVTALSSITGMLGAVHLWQSERAGAIGGRGRSRALEGVLASCFRSPGD
ncbi:TetR/AcrR family transcriptional regulator [Pseudokineococcus basanitobsidens]|uniref:TetR/AcrR family transcriptional regulator n=1 Tax=Pseudokineococcus basanitobsidens TaxID=1926649 RepID=A0ABU8RL36_9ACTN